MQRGPQEDDWIERYELGHQHPVNRICHLIGIPMIAVSLVFALAGFLVEQLWWVAGALFLLGWVLQFVGHWYEKKPPEFLKDWRFLFVGLRWWGKKIMGRV